MHAQACHTSTVPGNHMTMLQCEDVHVVHVLKRHIAACSNALRRPAPAALDACAAPPVEEWKRKQSFVHLLDSIT